MALTKRLKHWLKLIESFAEAVEEGPFGFLDRRISVLETRIKELETRLADAESCPDRGMNERPKLSHISSSMNG